MAINKLALYDEVESQIRDLSKDYDYNLRDVEVGVLLSKFKKDVEYTTDTEETTSIYIPKFQRKFVWEKRRKCIYIESLILGIPTPPLFMVLKDDTANMELIDGVQRLSTIDEFVNGNLKLQGLEQLTSLNGYRYKNLHPARQRKFNAIGLRYYVINENADEGVFAEIFKRINTGSKTLTEAEIRKGAFANNKFYRFILDKCIVLPEFTTLFTTKKDDNKLRGEKEELISRFFAYSDTYLDFKHSVKHFIDSYISKMGTVEFDENEKIEELRRSMQFISDNIPNGFNKEDGGRAIPRVRFEAIAIGVNLALRENPDLVISNTDWIESEEFKYYTTSDAANNKNKLRGRIEFVRDSLLGKNIKQQD